MSGFPNYRDFIVKKKKQPHESAAVDNNTFIMLAAISGEGKDGEKTKNHRLGDWEERQTSSRKEI